MKNTCTQCSANFEITEEDLEFYDKISPVFSGTKYHIPAPTHCPDCRLQRRLIWRNDWSLYMRNCDITGQKMMSTIPADAPYTVVHHNEWKGGKWNALDYAKDFDFNKTFFGQFDELLHKVPLLTTSVDYLENCDYVNHCGHCKNCYLIVESEGNQDCMYCYRLWSSNNCIDCTEVKKSELCYECTDCETCFSLLFSQQCLNCRDSAFLFDCRNCSDCFGCTGLRNKRYCIFNKQLSEPEYRSRMKEVDFCNTDHHDLAEKKLSSLKLQHPHKACTGEQNDNVSGDYIFESKDCSDCFDIIGCRDCRYCSYVLDAKDCMDFYVWGMGGERIYECLTVGYNPFALSFSAYCWEGVADLFYCFQCTQGTHHCFGCVGIHKGSYCIFNKQYTKQEYEALVPRIIEHMQSTNEWGEFFPGTISPYGYNETNAYTQFPLTKEESLHRGLKWQENLPHTIGKETIKWSQIPQTIDDVSDDICNEVLACHKTGKNFRITKKELLFYKKMHLPLPRKHHNERDAARMALRNPRKIWHRQCDKCSVAIQTTYAPERPEIVYCEQCYLNEVH